MGESQTISMFYQKLRIEADFDMISNFFRNSIWVMSDLEEKKFREQESNYTSFTDKCHLVISIEFFTDDPKIDWEKWLF